MANAGEHLFTPQDRDEVVRDGHVVARNVIGSGGYTKWFPLGDLPGWTRDARPGEVEAPAPPAAGDLLGGAAWTSRAPSRTLSAAGAASRGSRSSPPSRTRGARAKVGRVQGTRPPLGSREDQTLKGVVAGITTHEFTVQVGGHWWYCYRSRYRGRPWTIAFRFLDPDAPPETSTVVVGFLRSGHFPEREVRAFLVDGEPS